MLNARLALSLLALVRQELLLDITMLSRLAGLEEDDQGTVTYAPESSGFSSITIHYNVDGVLHKVTGCRGSFTLTANVGEFLQSISLLPAFMCLRSILRCHLLPMQSLLL